MSSRARVAAAIAAAGLVAVLAALALHTPVAAALRGVFRAVTPGVFLVLLGLAFLAAVAARLRPARSRGSSPRPHATLVDRLEWPISVAVLAAAGGVVWYSLGRAIVVPRIFGDELTHGEAARNLAQHGLSRDPRVRLRDPGDRRGRLPGHGERGRRPTASFRCSTSPWR